MPQITIKVKKGVKIMEGFETRIQTQTFEIPDETTQAMVQNPLSTESDKYVSVRRFWQGILYFISQGWTWAGKQIFSVAPRFSSVTANLPLKVNATKDLISGQIETNDVANKAITAEKLQDFPAYSILNNNTNAVGTATFQPFRPINEWIAPPATSTSPGVQGQKAYDSTYAYFCVQPDVWIKTPLSSW